ncbi:phytanoyl-CoA dioxygenase family protein [Nocardioides zeae]|uniref:Phytanoyl-CoA hydroxylase n=1 Tax=Nocardioides zeae TaxID=1457234 RepID=A0AAJ1U1N3_9ACTN|nr:phytanoyl-CoA dioxygenase family protein [Nocardioides zeae]MDQ1102851.1 phytanoyl-CoA hydroxylase [Nocardioides zeae]
MNGSESLGITRALHDPAHLEQIAHLDPRDPLVPEVFERDGVVVLDGVLTEREVARIERNVERYRKHMLAALPEDWVRRVGDDVVSGMYFMERVDPFFKGLGEDPVLRALVEVVTGARAHPMGVETFDKPAQVGSPALPHQDGVYFAETSTRIAHVWLPLDPTDAGNGAMWYWPGSHRGEILPHVPTDDPWLVQVDPDTVAMLPAPRLAALRPGSVIIHHDRIVHASPPNASPQSRRAVAIAWQLDL